jgi:nitroimidazol reductase NimA-like FMN-containing flavoprotein (pyridoxamine 5'-phosphate oxidase superfamily)
MENERMLRSEIPAWDCFQLLDEKRIGRLGILENGYPVAIPVSYRLAGPPSDRCIVIRTAPSTTIAQYEGRASLEIDHIDEREKTAWSVIARGNLHRLFGNDEFPDPQPWLIEGRHLRLALSIVAVSGRRFVGRQSDEGSGLEWRLE